MALLKDSNSPSLHTRRGRERKERLLIDGCGLHLELKMEGGSVRRNIALKLKEPAAIPSVKTQPTNGKI